MTADVSKQFEWQAESWDQLYTILFTVEGDESSAPRVQYMLYDNPADWAIFESWTETYLDITSNQLQNLLDFKSYSMRLKCDLRVETTSAEGVKNYEKALGTGCCLMDMSP
jgi:hypothetical protein